MPSSPLPNYLRTHRKRLALSQEEIAFLLGTQSGAKVCRNERFAREPSLATALAYVVIFQTPASELFAGLYQQIEKEVQARAKKLDRGYARRNPTPELAKKRRALTKVTNRKIDDSPNNQ